MKLLTALSLVASASAAVTSLTSENWIEKTAGKTVFIKYFAPWCGHCQSMAADWEKLANDWNESDVGLVAEVDCTDEMSEELCELAGIEGFPTMKWGVPDALEDYVGGRDYEELSAFAKENLKPVCSVQNLDLCDEDKKATIERYMNLSYEQLMEKIDAAEDLIRKEEEKIEEELEKLQDAYTRMMDDHSNKVKQVKADTDYGLLTSILASMDAPEGFVSEEDDDEEGMDEGAEL